VPANPVRRQLRAPNRPHPESLATVVSVLRRVDSAPLGTARLDPAVAMALREEATRYGMPLMVEPLVMQDNVKAGGGYMVDGDTQKIRSLVRQARELGADLIKADPCDNIEEYHQVIEVAGDTPLLVRGGGKVDDRTLLERTVAVLAQGASGIVYGRNIIQHDNPAGITAALMAVLHDNASVDQALAIVGSTS
jgi:DhnA family fructose-bisphosphate aldolase class Ia